MHQQIMGHAPLTLDWINQASFGHINTVTFTFGYKPQMKCSCIIMSLNLPQEDSSLWMLLITGHLPKNTPYGMQQLQHYSFGWQISILQCSAMPLKGSTPPPFAVILPSTCDMYKKKYYLFTS